jgi:hypothetical protein
MWSMKTDRELIKLSKTHTLDEIADKLHRSPKSVAEKAKRLGLSIKCDRPKAKGK